MLKQILAYSKKKLCLSGISEGAVENFVTNARDTAHRFETGSITREKFINDCIILLDNSVSAEIFTECFNGMFDEITEMKDFLSDLSAGRKYNLFLLSNTNSIHFEYIIEKYKYVSQLKDFFLSYKLGCRKPDEDIYKKIIKENNINPSETIFIDDLLPNCEAAEKAGIKSIHYTGYIDFLPKFNLLTSNY